MLAKYARLAKRLAKAKKAAQGKGGKVVDLVASSLTWAEKKPLQVGDR